MPESPQAPTSARWYHFRLSGFMMAWAAAGIAISLLGFAGRLWWPLELCSHFRVQYGLGLFLAAIGLALTRKWIWLAVTLAAGLLNLGLVAPACYGPTPPEGPRQVRVMLLNLNAANREFDRVLDLIRQEDPDLVALLEVDHSWAQALAPLRKRYKGWSERARPDNFGILFMTRLPVEELTIFKLGGGQACVEAKLRTEQGPLTVLAAHPVPPSSAHWAAQRNRQLAAMAQKLAATPGARMLLGDLNLSPWSPYFSDLLETSGLRDSRAGFGLQTTWPTQLFLLRLPIDHCLVSPELAVIDHRVGPEVGSDHFPLIVDLRFQTKAPPENRPPNQGSSSSEQH